MNSHGDDDAWECAVRVQPHLTSEVRRAEGTWVTLASGSMSPTLEPGTRIHVQDQPVHIGDVIVFLTADGTHAVVHRVVLCAPGLPWIVQAGDSHRNEGNVGLIRRRQVVGVADLPRRLPSPHLCAATLRLIANGVVRRLRRRFNAEHARDLPRT